MLVDVTFNYRKKNTKTKLTKISIYHEEIHIQNRVLSDT